MQEIQWNEVVHFTKAENWGDPSKMSPQIVACIDWFRDKIDKEIIITCGTQGQHVANSHHLEGFAIDCIIPKINLIDGFINAVRFPFTGIGIYPDWEYLGKKTGGFHFELVPANKEFPKKLWMGIGNCISQQYIALNYENLKQHGSF